MRGVEVQGGMGEKTLTVDGWEVLARARVLCAEDDDDEEKAAAGGGVVVVGEGVDM